MTLTADGLDRARLEAVTELEQIRRECKFSLAAHAGFVHRDDQGRRIRPVLHHELWIEVLEESSRYPFVVLIAPPGTAKSTWVSTIYPTWRIGATAGKIRMGLVCNTATLAEGFSGAVMDAIRSPDFGAAYPGVRPDYERGWAKSAFYVHGCPAGPNPTLFATGIGGAVQGRRVDEIILDDPTTWEEARSEAHMEAQRRFVKGILIQRLPLGRRPPDGRGSRIVVVLTRWAKHDLVPLFEDLGFQIFNLPALSLGQDEDLLRRPAGAPLWPEAVANAPVEDAVAMDFYRRAIDAGGWPEDMLEHYAEIVELARARLEEQRYEDEILFELVMQGNPDVLAGDFFDPFFFQREVPPLDENGEPLLTAFGKRVLAIDTASGKKSAPKKKRDYDAMLVMGQIGLDGWVLDLVHGQFNFPDKVTAVVSLCERWEPTLVAIEDANEGHALFQHLVSHYRLPLKLVPPTESKEVRAMPLSAAYKAQRIFHRRGQPWVHGLEAEMEAFPAGVHDDRVDAAAVAWNELAPSQGPMRVRALGGS